MYKVHKAHKLLANLCEMRTREMRLQQSAEWEGKPN
jgi:hypothetical protein